MGIYRVFYQYVNYFALQDVFYGYRNIQCATQLKTTKFGLAEYYVLWLRREFE